MDEIESIKKVLTLPDLVSITKEDKNLIFTFKDNSTVHVTPADWTSPLKLKRRFMYFGYIIPLLLNKPDNRGFSVFDHVLQFILDIATKKN